MRHLWAHTCMTLGTHQGRIRHSAIQCSGVKRSDLRHLCKTPGAMLRSPSTADAALDSLGAPGVAPQSSWGPRTRRSG